MNLLEQFRTLPTEVFSIGINHFNLFKRPLTDLDVKTDSTVHRTVQMHIKSNVCTKNNPDLLPLKNSPIAIFGIHERSKDLNNETIFAIGRRGLTRPTTAVKLQHIIGSNIVLDNTRELISSEVTSIATEVAT